MATNRHRYAKPPIVEAVIDLQTSFAAIPSAERFAEYQRRVSDRFSSATPIRQVQFGFEVGTSESHKVVESQLGYRLATENNDRVLQVQTRGFSLSHMPPYTDWESFSAEARTLWDAFREVCSPTAVTRTAVRFINRITIPKTGIELSDYFRLYPAIPGGIPQDTSGVFMQLQMPQSDLQLNAMAVVNLALVEPELPESTTILLDFDLFATDSIEPQSESIWRILEVFGKRKNELFEACITDETRELFK